MASQTHRQVTADIVQALQVGMVPWRMPWYGPGKALPPFNIITRRTYTGIDQLILQLAAQKHGFRLKAWGTKEEWRSFCDCPLQDRAVGTAIDEVLLFNAEQVECGFIQDFRSRPDDAQPDWSAAETVIAATNADVRHVFDLKAEYYYPPLDYIIFPFKEAFVQGKGGLPAYYESLAHELLHWSEVRLGFSADYATCELRAEMGSCFFASKLRLPNLTNLEMLKNHVRFAPIWCEAMNSDPDLIFRISASANESADYLLGFCQNKDRERAA